MLSGVAKGAAALVLGVGLAGCQTAQEQDVAAQDEALGQQVFVDVCQRCHRYPEDIREPRDFLETTIHRGPGRMPAVGEQLSAEQEEAVVRYLSR